MTSTVQHRGSISGIRRSVESVALALAIVVVPAVIATHSAQAQTFSVLHAFTGGADGILTRTGLVRDAAGNLYGTALGGSGPCLFPFLGGCGVVFKLDSAGNETVLHNFTGGADGAFPVAGLIRDTASNLYGTTPNGGDLSALGGLGCGVVFKLDSAGNETVLYSFTGGADGCQPFAGLVRDKAGNLYGTTAGGGASGKGTVFKLEKTGKETVLHSFTGPPDGELPSAGLVRDDAGNLYGTTVNGGDTGDGTVFKLDTTGKETVLHSFTGPMRGGGLHPEAGLVRDTVGNLYGTTEGGGAFNGNGVVFELDTTGKETVLYSFTGGVDGSAPFAGLVRDRNGNLYGTTVGGGASSEGTVFKLDTTGKENVLHSFTGGADGAFPQAGLIRDDAGNLYGTAQFGGDLTCSSPFLGGCGTVFKLTP